VQLDLFVAQAAADQQGMRINKCHILSVAWPPFSKA
jgi:hypothetical protein